jgi:aspartate-semialdehyde dehydrogenase
MVAKQKVGLLGATGTVGQRFILLLADHPNFTLHKLGASSASVGKTYRDAVKGRWKQVVGIPSNVSGMDVIQCNVENFKDCDIVFSGLDSGPAAELEPAFRSAELRVFSNAKNFRQDELCPLVVPIANEVHLGMIPYQQKRLNLKRGFIVTNANCSTTGILPPLKALRDAFGPLDKVVVATLQAVSGAGYPGVSSFDIHDNVVPYISGEEEKIEAETKKMLGTLEQVQGADADARAFVKDEVTVSAQCNRVPVLDGHTECLSISFKNRPGPTPEQVKEALRNYTCEAQRLKCHSAPAQPIVVHEDEDRPQPRLDRDHQNGSCIHVGRVRKCPVFDIKFVVLSNNVMIGAATSSVMNAEIALAQGFLD